MRLSIVLAALAVGIALQSTAGAESPGSAQIKPLPTQVNKEGQVVVRVTPLALSTAADPWRFEVQLDTHVMPLDQDLRTVAVLTDGNGHDERPTAWEGDPPGGHHRKGVLLFRQISPSPASVTLKIREVGSVPERSFTWALGNS